MANGNGQGVQAKLWAMADALRNNMDAAEYTRPTSRKRPPSPCWSRLRCYRRIGSRCDQRLPGSVAMQPDREIKPLGGQSQPLLRFCRSQNCSFLLHYLDEADVFRTSRAIQGYTGGSHVEHTSPLYPEDSSRGFSSSLKCCRSKRPRPAEQRFREMRSGLRDWPRNICLWAAGQRIL